MSNEEPKAPPGTKQRRKLKQPPRPYRLLLTSDERKTLRLATKEARAMLDAVSTELQGGQGVDQEFLEKSLEEIIKEFVSMRDQAKRPSAKDYRDHLGAIQSASNQLRMCILNTLNKNPAVLSKVDWGLRKSIGLELRGRPGAGVGLEHQLGTLARLCEEGMNVEGAPGRHNKNHVDVAALALARLWIEVSGKPFIKTFVPWHDHDRAGGELRFVEPGPRFVETILKVIAHALAPELEGNEIQSRIRVALTGFDISKRGSGNAQTRAE